MTVDEMDLVRQLKDAAPLRPGAYEQARTTLRAAMAGTGPARVPGAVPLRRSRARIRHASLGPRGKAGIAAGTGAVAAAVAVALVVTPAPRSAAPKPTVSQAPAAGSRLVSLAALIRAGGGALPGDASLVIRTQAISGKPPEVSYNLYTDSGAYYGGGDESSLRQVVARHENEADGIDAREVAAARYAAAGDLATARKRMVNATPNPWGLGLSPAAQQAVWDKAVAAHRDIYREKGIPLPKRPAGQALRDDIDNYVWNNSVDALAGGAGSPQVRAGVLRLLSTIPEVTVANSRTGGQPALTLTAGPALFGGGVEQVLTINARTGMPVRSVMNARGNEPSSVSTYQVSRVTLAGIEAGKF